MGRTYEEIRLQPCRWKMRDIPGQVQTQTTQSVTTENGVRKVKKTVQKLDSNGQPVYKTITEEVKKGCGCGGKKQTVETVTKQVPDTIEVWVDEPSDTIPQETQTSITENTVACKMYGMVKESYCLVCKSYQK
jgi:hypothetical protein